MAGYLWRRGGGSGPEECYHAGVDETRQRPQGSGEINEGVATF